VADATLVEHHDASTPPAVAVDPSRLVLLPSTTRTWTTLRVARCDGARAVLVQRDGSTTTRPLAVLRAPRFATGTEVMALWGEGAGTPYHATVLEQTNDRVHIRYDDASEETVDVARIESATSAGTLPALAQPCALRRGALPVALVEERLWRTVATVIECGGANALVESARDARRTVPVATLARPSYTGGDRVMIRWRDGGDYGARVERATEGTLDVTYDDGSTETVSVAQVLSWAPGQGPVRPTQPFRCATQ
jgi:hypothetical protein